MGFQKRGVKVMHLQPGEARRDRTYIKHKADMKDMSIEHREFKYISQLNKLGHIN